MKGQYFSFDAIIAAVIFILALVALLSYWHSIRSYLDYQNDPLSRESVRMSNLLFAPPSPSGNCSSMGRLGLSMDFDDRRVNESVLECASSQNQAWVRDRLGTPYGISIMVTDLSDNSVSFIGGNVPDPAPQNVVKIRRLATVVNSTGGTYPAAFDISMYR
jgi:hypothetical protein